MATNYPYYIPTYMEAGQMKKIFGQSKFHACADAINALKKRYKMVEDCLNTKLMDKKQFVILEYASTYDSKIVAIINFGEDNLVYVNTPIVLSK